MQAYFSTFTHGFRRGFVTSICTLTVSALVACGGGTVPVREPKQPSSYARLFRLTLRWAWLSLPPPDTCGKLATSLFLAC